MHGMLTYSQIVSQWIQGEGDGRGSEPLVTLADDSPHDKAARDADSSEPLVSVVTLVDAPPHVEAARDADSSEPLVSVVTLVDAPPHEVAARDADSSEAHVPPTTPPHPSTSHRLQKAALERSLTVE